MLGNNIRDLRIEQGLTIKDLAAISEVSKSYIWELELHTKINPSLGVLNNLASALGVPVTRLLT